MRELRYKQIWYDGDTTDEVINIPSNMLLIKTPYEYNNSDFIYENAEHYCGICKLTDELPEFDCDEDGYNIIDDIGGDIFSDLGLLDFNNIILSDECKDLVITPEEAAEKFQLHKYYIVRFLQNGAFESIYNINKIYNYSHVESNAVCTVVKNQRFVDNNTMKDIKFLDIIDVFKLTCSGLCDSNNIVTIHNSDENPYVKELYQTLVKYVTDLLLKNEINYEIPDVDYYMIDNNETNIENLFECYKNTLDYFHLKKQFPLKMI
jgi:hypothetical protein